MRNGNYGQVQAHYCGAHQPESGGKLRTVGDDVDKLRGNEVAHCCDEYDDVESDGVDAARIDSAINRQEMIYAFGVGIVWFAFWALLR